MRHLLLILCLTVQCTLSAQVGDPWIKFVTPETRLAGFKDASGTIRIPAKFENYYVADTFHNIIAVREPVGKKYESYYLLKNGGKAAFDSLYVYDGYDCESDGMIRYKDLRTGYLGYLNKNGVAVIPAIYNTATRFVNGWAQGLMNARKRCWDETDDTLDCDRLLWEGGKTVLINKQNEIIAEGLPSEFYQTVDWYSVITNKRPEDTSIYYKVTGKNNNIYYFIDFEKEFKKWFHTEFLPSLSSNKSKYLFPEMLVWDEKTSWHSISRDAYLTSYSGVLKKERFQTNANKQLSFAKGEFNDHVMTSPIYRPFYTACGQFDKYRYPLFLVQISYYTKNQQFDHSESFEFIRTPQGYRLLESPTKF